MTIAIKRVYDPVGEDGIRILVDRLWPRGLKKENLHGQWAKELGPSTELRKWFGHDPEKWQEFKQKYFAELDAQVEAVQQIRAQAREGLVTLLFASHESNYNQAVALREYLEKESH
ncbi:MAG: DUF488 family protein [Desulfovibrionales bacterium]|nr:DUF488 family protein [Desulfovibrionales bacterium]